MPATGDRGVSLGGWRENAEIRIVVSISGGRGSGKSNLAHHLADYLRERGHDVTVDRSVDVLGKDQVPFEAIPIRKILIRESVPHSD